MLIVDSRFNQTRSLSLLKIRFPDQTVKSILPIAVVKVKDQIIVRGERRSGERSTDDFAT